MVGLRRVLVVGGGSIGDRHLRCFQATARAGLSLCEIDPVVRGQAAGRYGLCRCYADLDEALADRHEAAVIATPAHLHVPMALRLAEAGMHLLIEKPLGTCREGVEQLRQTVARRGVTAAVAYVYRAHPVLRALRQAIASERFGRPLQVTGVGGQHFPTYRPAYRQTYYRDRATGGGAIQDALTHLLDAAAWLVGPIDCLVADAAHQALDGVEVEDTVHVLARHGNVLGCYSLNQHQAPNEITLTVACHRGTARYEHHFDRWRWMARPGESWHDEPGETRPRDALFIDQAHAFLDAVEGRAPPLCGLEEGIQALRVNLAALASTLQHAWQTV
jgi:predicted dehydrogenase